MAITHLNPYLIFDGRGGQAIELYTSALGAVVEHLQRFGDMPGASLPDEHKSRVMHAVVRIGGGTVMISDDQPGHAPARGTNTFVALHLDDVDDTTRKFEALAKGGTVLQPLQDTFWGARFGMLIDAFGVSWMFNCDLKKR